MIAPAPKTKADSIWRFLVRHREGILDAQAQGLISDIQDLGISGAARAQIAQVFYLVGPLSSPDRERLGQELLTDPLTQEYTAQSLDLEDHPSLLTTLVPSPMTIEVAYHPGVRDPVEDSLKKGALDLGIRDIQAVHTAKAYTFWGALSPEALTKVTDKLLVNGTIQQVVTPENLHQILFPSTVTPVAIETVHLLNASDTVLQRVSLDHQLSLNLEEMRTIQAYFRKANREPTLIELETLAQTWSEHCKHKTLKGDIVYTEEIDGKSQKRTIPNLLKSTVFEATRSLNLPWCVSVFVDNAGVIEFDADSCLAFKVETHNHPSALEPFGGASTGIGGVIRDILGTGLGAKPIASTDVFCFPPPDFPLNEVPEGTLYPRRLIKGVVSGVQDYGNKMGIPTVNGAVLFDPRFVGNPLVFCGNVGLIPRDAVVKKVSPGMKIVLVGGATGRDGIHGATFSSIALATESETISSTAVQIGDPITEKKLSDALLEARDLKLYQAVTDCGAGGLSSAVGELGAQAGAVVHLEKVPLKYAGLTPTEIWISESQERMVLAVEPQNLDKLTQLFRARGTQATVIGDFTDTGKLELFFRGTGVGTLEMEFLHEGVPQLARAARWVSPSLKEPMIPSGPNTTQTLLELLKRWDTCSKEWIVRRYDHEVQGGSALKPFLGADHSAPSDAAVIRPKLTSPRGAALANGINFRYGDIDPYWMAILCIEEAIRQLVCVGADPNRIAILDNFCWADPTKPLVLGSLVRAALGCLDGAKAFRTPFISGKDSLHNEYRVGEKTIQIPGTLLISSIGIVPDVTRAISMDAKRSGNRLCLVGITKSELGGSAYYDLSGELGASVPQVDLQKAPQQIQAVSQAIRQGLVLSAHDCSEGGLAVAAAEMAFAGGLGLTLDLRKVVAPEKLKEEVLLFSESPTRFLLEVEEAKAAELEKSLKGFPIAWIGTFEQNPIFQVLGHQGQTVVETSTAALKEAWQAPFRGW